MKNLILVLCFVFYGFKEQEFEKVSLFNGKFIYSVPKGMHAFEPPMSYREDYKYVRYYLNKDSSLRIEVNLRYSQVNGLQTYRDSERDELLSRIDGADIRVISNELQILHNKKVIMIYCEYSLPGVMRNKAMAKRLVFNTSAGLTSVTLLYNFKIAEEKKYGQEVFQSIIEKLEMH